MRTIKKVTNQDIIGGFFMFAGADMYDGFYQKPRLKSDENIDKWIYTRLEQNSEFINE